MTCPNRIPGNRTLYDIGLAAIIALKPLRQGVQQFDGLSDSPGLGRSKGVFDDGQIMGAIPKFIAVRAEFRTRCRHPAEFLAHGAFHHGDRRIGWN
jgi:hypothetical protein